MRQEIPSKAALWGHPIHPMLIPFPIASLVGLLLTDITYSTTGNLFWADASRWLLVAGVTTGILAALVGAVDYFGKPEIRQKRIATGHALGNALALVLAVINLVSRLDDVTNISLALSLITVLILVVTGWLGGELSYRHLVGVDSAPNE